MQAGELGAMAMMDGWEDFYVIVGSSSGALIGLQFVVLTLVADRPGQASPASSSAFLTPTIIHLSAVLLLSSAACIPWPSRTGLTLFWLICGLAGAIYTLDVARRMTRQKDYRPQAEDWIFHTVLPILAYAAIFSCALTWRTALPPFVAGAAALLLMFVGIHNAWDAITYNAFARRERDAAETD